MEEGMGLCYFGRQLIASTYQEVCRGAFNSMLVTAALKSEAIGSLMKAVGITAKRFPAAHNLFFFGAIAGGTRGALVVVINKLDFFNMKKHYEKPYQVFQFALTFFASLKMAEFTCKSFNVPVRLSAKVVIIGLSDYGLSLFVNELFDPMRSPK
jgi:hypothetical protein